MFLNIPDELRGLQQFVLWKLQQRQNKSTKVPFQPNNKAAKSNNPATWTTFQSALDAYQRGSFSGIGLMFANGYAGIDLDHCRDPETGEIEEYAKSIVERLDSYTEVSPSGTGLHILIKASLPEAGLKREIYGHKIEIYSSKRFFTLTGQCIEGAPISINERQQEALDLYREVFDDKSTKAARPQKAITRKISEGKGEAREKASAGNPVFSDGEIIVRAGRAKNGAKFKKLWSGDASDYATRSEADQALVDLLCFWSPADAQVERLWRQSGLYRDKTDRQDYVSWTIQEARSTQLAAYAGRPLVSEPVAQEATNHDEEYGAPVSADPRREIYLRQIARNTAKLLDATRIIMRELGFKKNHHRLLNALTRKGGDKLGFYKCKQEWLLEEYKRETAIKTTRSIRNDLAKLIAEQQRLGVEIVAYKKGSKDFSKDINYVSRFKNIFVRLALEAINAALDTKAEFDYSFEALEAACKEVAARVPRSAYLLAVADESEKRLKPEMSLELFLKDLAAKASRYETGIAICERLIEEGASKEDCLAVTAGIAADWYHIAHGRVAGGVVTKYVTLSSL